LGITFKESQSLRTWRAPSLQAEPFGALLAQLNQLLEDESLNGQHVRVLLHQSDDRVKSLQMAIDQSDLWRDQALNWEENVTAGEEHFKRLIQMLDELMHIIHTRISIASGQGNQSVVTKNFEGTLQRIQQEVTKHRGANESLRQRIAKDLQTLEALLQNSARDDQMKSVEFVRRRDQDIAALDTNAKKQSDAWHGVLTAIGVVLQLHNERSGLVAGVVNAREAEDQRHQAYQALLESTQTQKSNLQQILRELDQFEKLFAEVQSCGEEAKKKLSDKIQVADAVLRNVRLDEQRNHLSVFRRYSLTLGDYLYRREKRVTDISKAIRSVAMSREVARDVLDRNVDRYDGDRQSLEQERADLTAETAMLKKSMDGAMALFVPTEQALHLAGVKFVHPTKELDGILAQRETEAQAVRKKYDPS